MRIRIRNKSSIKSQKIKMLATSTLSLVNCPMTQFHNKINKKMPRSKPMSPRRKIKKKRAQSAISKLLKTPSTTLFMMKSQELLKPPPSSKMPHHTKMTKQN